MKELLMKAAELLDGGEDVVLVTIIASSGSTPRGTGARMLVGKNGRVCGTIGGGAVEYRAEQLALDALRRGVSYIHSFTLTKNDVEDLGAICGGTMTVHFRCLRSSDGDAAALRAGAALIDRALDVWMFTEITDGGTIGFYTAEEGFCGMDNLEEALLFLTRRPVTKEFGETSLYIEQVGSSGFVYVFGGGHVAQELVPVLSHVGFHCIVLEDRPEFLSRDVFPTAFETRRVDFNDIFQSVSLTERDYVIIMTRGHTFDYAVERQALGAPSRYIGVIGSAIKTAGVNAMLRADGITQEQLDRVTTPIGLSIHAETPAEIAISVAAQLIAVRAGK